MTHEALLDRLLLRREAFVLVARVRERAAVDLDAAQDLSWGVALRDAHAAGEPEEVRIASRFLVAEHARRHRSWIDERTRRSALGTELHLLARLADLDALCS